MRRRIVPPPFRACCALLLGLATACGSGGSGPERDVPHDATPADAAGDATPDTADPGPPDAPADLPQDDATADVAPDGTADAPGEVVPLPIPYVTPPWDRPIVDRPFLQEDNSNPRMDAGHAPLIALAAPGPGDDAPRRIAPRGVVARTPQGGDMLRAIPGDDPDLVGAGVAGDTLLLVGPRRLYVPAGDGLAATDLAMAGPDEAIAGVAQGAGRVLAWTATRLALIGGPDDVAWVPAPGRITAALETDARILLAGVPADAPDGSPFLVQVPSGSPDAVPNPLAADGALDGVGTVRALVADVALPLPLALVVVGDGGLRGFVDADVPPAVPVSVPLFAADRVPLGAPTSAIRTSDGGFLVTTRGGAYRAMDRDIGPEWRVYNARRWVPDGDVRAAWTDPDLPDGPIWFATAGGQSRVTARRITLEAKMADLIDRIVTRHDRDGAVADSRQTVPGDLSTNIPWDSDNDGGWTCYWVLAECFRYKVTGDPEAKGHFDRSLERMLSFRTLSGADWFVARSVIRKATCNLDDCDAPDDGEWFTSPDGEWWVKSDTSNDEVTSHMFMMAHAYELCADEAQRQAIREHVGGIVGGLVDHGFRLLKPDGVPTTYGQFDPDYVNSVIGMLADGGRRSAQMLAALDLALALTGDPKFADARRLLIDQHHYHENVVTESEAPGRRGSGDGDELATQAFFVLLRYETDPALHAMFREGWRRTYGNMRLQQAALWDVIDGVLGGDAPDFANAVRWLKLAPTDGIRWTLNNLQRADLALPPEYYRVSGQPRRMRSDGRILPADERPNIRHNTSQYEVEGGWGDGVEIDGADIVAAYWMARYHGFIVPESD
jgi:hypothetical protein